MGVGECAGEVVAPVEFGLAASEREVFEAQLRLERGEPAAASRGPTARMLHGGRGAGAARESIQVSERGRTRWSREFRPNFHDTRAASTIRFAGGKFAPLPLQRRTASTALRGPTAEAAHHAIEEAQLFIEAAYGCYGRLSAEAARKAPPGNAAPPPVPAE